MEGTDRALARDAAAPRSHDRMARAAGAGTGRRVPPTRCPRTLRASSACDRAGVGRQGRARRDADRVGQDDRLRRAGDPTVDRDQRRFACAVPLPDQGPVPGSDRRPDRADLRAAGCGRRTGLERVHVRRGHAAVGAPQPARSRTPDPDQSVDAASGHPAQPRQVGRAVPRPRVRRRRRGA